MATIRCFSTSGLPRQNQQGPLGAGGRVGGWEGADVDEGDWERRGVRLACGVPLSEEENRKKNNQGIRVIRISRQYSKPSQSLKDIEPETRTRSLE